MANSDRNDVHPREGLTPEAPKGLGTFNGAPIKIRAVLDDVADYPGMQERFPRTSYGLAILAQEMADIVGEIDEMLAGEEGDDGDVDRKLETVLKEIVETLAVPGVEEDEDDE